MKLAGRLSERKVLFFIFCSALAIRALLAYLNISSPFIVYNPQLETFNDFQSYYLTWLHSLGVGLLPYRDFFYQYPPLFLYGLYPLYHLGGAFGAAFGIILADSGSAVLIYILVREGFGRNSALAAGIGYAVNPLALLYEGYLLLSLQPMMFFLLLVAFYLNRGMLKSAAFSFGIAILLKQQAFFLTPSILLYIRRFDFASTAKAALTLVVLVTIVSAPFLLAAPSQYINTLAYRPVYYSSISANSSRPPPTSTCFLSQNLMTVVGTCVLGTTTTIMHGSIPLSSQITAVLNAISRWVLIPIALLVLPALYYFRRRPSFFALTGAYSCALLVMLVAYSASSVPLEQVARYPYLPVYALLLMASRGWKSASTTVGFASLSLLIPSGIFQLVMPYFSIIGVMVVLDSEDEGSRGAVVGDED